MLYFPANYMQVWVVDSISNRGHLAEIRAKSFGAPISEITTFKPSNFVSDPIELSSLIQILELHHPFMTRLNIMGMESSLALSANLLQSGYSAAREMWPDTIAFKRSLPSDVDVPQLRLNAADWKTPDDVYDSLFAQIGAPAWHGHNFNALNDSIVTGGVNSVEVPYALSVEGLDNATPNAQAFAKELIQLFAEFESWGCPVSMKVVPATGAVE